MIDRCRKGEVFILEARPNGDIHRRVRAERVSDPSLVISCALCERPARYLDEAFPYHWELNRCQECWRHPPRRAEPIQPANVLEFLRRQASPPDPDVGLDF
jgi:hypothetical protein